MSLHTENTNNRPIGNFRLRRVLNAVHKLGGVVHGVTESFRVTYRPKKTDSNDDFDLLKQFNFIDISAELPTLR